MTPAELEASLAVLAGVEQDARRAQAFLTRLAALDVELLAELPTLAGVDPAVIAKFVEFREDRRTAEAALATKTELLGKRDQEIGIIRAALNDIGDNFASMTKPQIGAALQTALAQMNAIRGIA